MDFNPEWTPEELTGYLAGELGRSRKDKKHPFRFFTLSTCFQQEAWSRMVVLRDIPEAWTFRIFTDARSQKIQHWAQNPQASLLFYHAKKQLQLVVQAEARVYSEGEILEKNWARVPAYMQKDYQSAHTPGSGLKWNSLSHPLDQGLGQRFFRVVDLKAIRWDVLKLRRDGHLRFHGFSTEAGVWRVERVVP